MWGHPYLNLHNTLRNTLWQTSQSELVFSKIKLRGAFKNPFIVLNNRFSINMLYNYVTSQGTI